LATEYTVALRDGVSGPADKAAASARKLRSALLELEEAKASVGLGGRGSGGVRGGADRSAAAAARAAAQQVKAAERAQAQITRDEMRFSAYRLRLNRQEHMQRDRAEKAALRSHLKYIKERQRAEDRAAKAKSRARAETRANFMSAIGNPVIGIGAGIAGAGVAAIGAVAKQGIETAQLLENAKMTLGALYKDQKRADATVADMYKFAQETKFDSPDLISMITKIGTVIDDPRQQRQMLGAMADISTMLSLSGEDMDRAFVNIQQSFSAGRVEKKDLREFIHAMPGFKGDEMKMGIAELLKISGKSKEDILEKVEKEIAKGKLGPQTLIAAFEKQVLKQTGKNKLGEYSEQMGGTLTGLISNIKNGLGDLFGQAEIEKWPAMLELKAILTDIANSFKPGTENGKKLTAMLKSMSELAVPMVKMGKAVFDLMVYLGSSPKLIKMLGIGLLVVGAGLLAVTVLVGLAAAAISALIGAITYSIYKLIEFGISAYKAGADFVTGLAKGIKDGVGKVWEAASGIASTAVAAIKEKLHIASPSRVAMKMGNQTGEGFAIGLERSARGVSQSAAALPAAAVSGMGAAQGSSSGMRMGGGMVFAPTLNFEVTGTNAEDIASRAIMKAKTELRTMLDQYFAQQYAMGGT